MKRERETSVSNLSLKSYSYIGKLFELTNELINISWKVVGVM